MISTPLRMGKPVRRPIVPPISPSWASVVTLENQFLCKERCTMSLRKSNLLKFLDLNLSIWSWWLWSPLIHFTHWGLFETVRSFWARLTVWALISSLTVFVNLRWNSFIDLDCPINLDNLGHSRQFRPLWTGVCLLCIELFAMVAVLTLTSLSISSKVAVSKKTRSSSRGACSTITAEKQRWLFSLAKRSMHCLLRFGFFGSNNRCLT